MACIKPPGHLSAPAIRWLGRLALTATSEAGSNAAAESPAAQTEFLAAQEASARAKGQIKSATTVRQIRDARNAGRQRLRSAIGKSLRHAQRQTLRDQLRDLNHEADLAIERIDGIRWSPRRSEPPMTGVIIDEDGNSHLVSFKTGLPGSPNEGDTLIADGDLREDNDAFNEAHNHYGPEHRKLTGFFEKDRGRYTGPHH